MPTQTQAGSYRADCSTLYAAHRSEMLGEKGWQILRLVVQSVIFVCLCGASPMISPSDMIKEVEGSKARFLRKAFEPTLLNVPLCGQVSPLLVQRGM